MKQVCIKYWKWKVPKRLIIDAAYEPFNNPATDKIIGIPDVYQAVHQLQGFKDIQYVDLRNV